MEDRELREKPKLLNDNNSSPLHARLYNARALASTVAVHLNGDLDSRARFLDAPPDSLGIRCHSLPFASTTSNTYRLSPLVSCIETCNGFHALRKRKKDSRTIAPICLDTHCFGCNTRYRPYAAQYAAQRLARPCVWPSAVAWLERSCTVRKPSLAALTMSCNDACFAVCSSNRLHSNVAASRRLL